MTHEDLQERLNSALMDAFNEGLTLAEVIGAIECTKLAVIDNVVDAVQTKENLANQVSKDGKQ